MYLYVPPPPLSAWRVKDTPSFGGEITRIDDGWYQAMWLGSLERDSDCGLLLVDLSV